MFDSQREMQRINDSNICGEPRALMLDLSRTNIAKKC